MVRLTHLLHVRDPPTFEQMMKELNKYNHNNNNNNKNNGNNSSTNHNIEELKRQKEAELKNKNRAALLMAAPVKMDAVRAALRDG